MSNQPELKLIYEDKGKHKRIIIFVHGLKGDPETSFGDWPKLIKEDDKEERGQLALSTYAVATFGYPAGWNDGFSLVDVKNSLLEALEDTRIFDDYKQIFFICHSLGGLVIKSLLIELKDDFPEYFQKIAAIFLIATPSQGSPLANWISFLPKFLVGRLVPDLQTIENNSYLQELENRWNKLLKQRKNICPRIYCAYERKATIILQVVSKVYMTTYCDKTSMPIGANHIDIVKPKSPGDPIYKWVRGCIADLQKELGSNATRDEFVNKIELEKLRKHLKKVCGEIQQVNKTFPIFIENLSNKIDKTEQNELEETHQKLTELQEIACEFHRDLEDAEQMDAHEEEAMEHVKRMRDLDSQVDKENNILQ
ncbi:SesB [Beggiatoa sp. PS]|nr:SesB [Beggiatoa sp. PS]